MPLFKSIKLYHKQDQRSQKVTHKRENIVTSLIQEVQRYLNLKLEVQNYLEQVYQHPRNVSIKIQKDILYRARDISKFV